MITYKIKKEAYPYLLKQISRLPPELDVAGTIPDDNNKFLCIIGSRTHSNYGREICEKIISGLAGYPIVIVSGLAIGIDSIAHETALKVGLKTIAFPGSGLDQNVLYPISRRNLASRIVKSSGALISPFNKLQIGTQWTFPTRNRLMAGISHAVLIIEARAGSGTLGTADYATELNRDVFAIPGNVFSDLSYGPHMLIQRGAATITCSNDILRELNLIPETSENKQNKFKSNKTKLIEQKQLSINLDQLILSPEEKMICNYIKNEPLSASDIIEKTSLNSTLFNITISELEMKNLVIQKDGFYHLQRS